MLSVMQVNSVVNLGQLHLGFFSGLRELVFGEKTQREPDEKYAALFERILHKSFGEQVEENKAREIFGAESVQDFFPRWYSFTLDTKIKFMDRFIKYSEEKFVEKETKSLAKEPEEGEHTNITLLDYCKVLSMATTYRGYLKRSTMGITKEHVVGAGAGLVAPTILGKLGEHVAFLAKFRGSVSSVLDKLNAFRGTGQVLSRALVPYGGG